jgi:phosphatidylserine decarboxylase
VHANWFPVNGTVTKVEHQDGNFYAAFKPKASTENERSLVVIRTTEGKEIMLRQIAGALARRVVTYCKPGDEAQINKHMGFIKFGSRVDVYLPVDTLICVKVNQKVTADISILAKLS